MSWVFKLEAPLHGFTISTGRSLWTKRAKAYAAWKEYVRLTANAAKVPQEIPEDERFGVRVLIYWNKKARVDGDNILKGATDSLFARDRRVSSGAYQSLEHTGVEKCEVGVWRVM